ncbi:MAG: hypothetical protein WC310_04750 [Patescibacteria group bacterium]|jgi:uncharacterized membrane protein YvbJ
MDQNIAQKYNIEERQKQKKERPVLYWGILAVVCIIVIIIFYTV